jgi:hypothetical protein
MNHPPLHVRLVLPYWLGLVATMTGIMAAPTGAQEWKTGAQLSQVLEESDPLSLTDRRLADGLQSLEEVYRVCIFLDRSVDPHQRISVTTPARPLSTRLRQIGTEAGLGCAFLEWGVYLGPPEIANALATLTEVQKNNIREGDRVLARRLLTERPFSWPQPSEPGKIVQDLATNFRVSFPDSQKLPYDLWAGRELPDMDFPSAMTLLLASFRSTYQWQPGGTALQLVPFPTEVSLTEAYRLPANRNAPVAVWEAEFDRARIRVQGKTLEVTGPSELHQQVQDWISGKSRRTPPRNGGTKALTLTIKSATLEQATDYLASQLSLEFTFSPEADGKRSERIAIDVKDASIEELLQELLSPLDLTFRLNEEQVHIDLAP